MIKFSKMAILVIFILLVFMSPSFALDNETADAVDAGIGEEPLAADIYVNASTDGTGDGSIDNPYRNLENVKILTIPTAIWRMSKSKRTVLCI